MAQPPPVLVRTYQASNSAEASRQFATDASELSAQGYKPTTQVWAGPSLARPIATPIIVTVAGLLVGSASPIGNPNGLLLGAAVGIIYVLALLQSHTIVGTLTVTYVRS